MKLVIFSYITLIKSCSYMFNFPLNRCVNTVQPIAHYLGKT
jgi:hypothetical protein